MQLDAPSDVPSSPPSGHPGKRHRLPFHLAAITITTSFLIACGEREKYTNPLGDPPLVESNSDVAIIEAEMPPAPPPSPEKGVTMPLAVVSYAIPAPGKRQERASAPAIAVAGPENLEGTLWLASMPGAMVPSRSPDVSLLPVQGEMRTVNGQRRNTYEASIVGQCPESGLVLLLADCVIDSPPFRVSPDGLASATQMWLLDADHETLLGERMDPSGGTSREGIAVESSRAVTLPVALRVDEPFSWPDGSAIAAAQILVPVCNAEGALAGLLVRGPEDRWSAHAVTDIDSLGREQIGPMDVAAIINSRGDELTIMVEGKLAPGLQRGQFVLALGQETDALQGFDPQGRRYLVDLENPGRSKLATTSFRLEEATGRQQASIRLRVPRDAGTHILAGQLLLQPVNRQGSMAIPFPPFTVRVDSHSLEVSGHDAFRARQSDRSGTSQSLLVAAAEIIPLPAAVMPNRAIFTGDRLVLPTDGKPAVWIHEVATAVMESLPSELPAAGLAVAADARRAFLLDREHGVLEVWNLADRTLASAGLIQDAGDVLAMAVLESGVEDMLVLACPDRFRFIAIEDLVERLPFVSPEHYNKQAFEDGYEMFDNDTPLEQALALRATQGGLVVFRGAPYFGKSGNPSHWVAVGPHPHPGRMRTERVNGLSQVGPLGVTLFSDDNLREFDAFRIGRSEPWSPGSRTSYDGSVVVGSFVGPMDMDPVFTLRRIAGAIPAAAPVLEVRSRNRPQAGEIPLGTLPEIAGCSDSPDGGAPMFSHHVFPVPERGLLLTLDDAGRQLYRRSLDVPAMLDTFGGGGFAICASPPALLQRGLPFQYQLAITGASEPSFKLVAAPEGASISPDGTLQWSNPADFPHEEVDFRIEITDAKTSLTLPWVMQAKLAGPVPTRVTSPDGAVLADTIPARIHDIPAGGLIREKIEAAFNRFHVMVTEIPDGSFRLEVFDAASETWASGVELPAFPAIICANPKIIYLTYPGAEILELRNITDPTEVRQVPLKLPVAGMGCSPDTTDGVLCLAERLNPEVVKVADFVDWDGTRVTTTRSQGPKARFVFLSPLSLRPVRVNVREEDLTQAVFFLGTQREDQFKRIVVSSDGWWLGVHHFVLDLNRGQGPARLIRHAGADESPWITEGGRQIYPGRYFRDDFNGNPVPDRAGFDRVERPSSHGASPHSSRLVPMPKSEIDVLTQVIDSRQEIDFLRRDNGEVILKVGPLFEIPQISHDRPNHGLIPRLALVHDKKLVTVGHRRRQIFVRDLPIP